MKHSIPWPAKFIAKIIFGILRIDYRTLKRAGIVEHGRMDDVNFSESIFDRHVRAILCERGLLPRGVLLELGPGDSVATGIRGRQAGFSEVVLVDVGPFADLEPCALARLFTMLGNVELPISADATPTQVLEALRLWGIRYLTSGVDSMRGIAPASVLHSFSNTVLQHVYRKDVPELVRLLSKAHAAGGYSSHLIKFTDHFSGGFLNHCLPAWFMESALIKRANLYTNRISALEFCDLFEHFGFDIEHIAVDFLSESAERAEYDDARSFRLGVNGRRILRAAFLLRRNKIVTKFGA